MALNERLQQRRDSNNSSDTEVFFNPSRNWSEQSIEFGESEGEPDMAQERRLQLLESAVLGMSDKFDAVMNSLSHSVSDPSPTGGHEAARPAGPTSPSPPHLHRQGSHPSHTARPLFADFVAEQLQREEFVVPRAEDGKVLTSDICAENLYPKPYMFLARTALNTIRKKRDARESMTFNEYLVSFLKMLRHPKTAPYFNHALLLEHLQQIVEDSLIREWSVVRRWSQAMFDKIEKGDHTWEDKSHTQLERIRYALLAQKSQHNDRQERREVPCRDFNSLTGCIHNGPHLGRHVNFIHVCSLCMSQTRDKMPHIVAGCPRGSRFSITVNIQQPRTKPTPVSKKTGSGHT